jgi:hypothetical protein
MLVPIHRFVLPRICGACVGHLSTGLDLEINPLGSLDGKPGLRLAIGPMISVPFCASGGIAGPSPALFRQKFSNDSRIGFLEGFL